MTDSEVALLSIALKAKATNIATTIMKCKLCIAVHNQNNHYAYFKLHWCGCDHGLYIIILEIFTHYLKISNLLVIRHFYKSKILWNARTLIYVILIPKGFYDASIWGRYMIHCGGNRTRHLASTHNWYFFKLTACSLWVAFITLWNQEWSRSGVQLMESNVKKLYFSFIV